MKFVELKSKWGNIVEDIENTRRKKQHMYVPKTVSKWSFLRTLLLLFLSLKRKKIERKIPLHNRKKEVVGYAIVSPENYECLNQFKWSKVVKYKNSKNEYAQGKKCRRKNVVDAYLHRKSFTWYYD